MVKTKSRTKSRTKSKPKRKSVTVAGLKRAIEGRKANALAEMYADDAVMHVIDRDNPPSKPREVVGKNAISTFWDDICSRAMKHTVENGISNGDQIAFTQACDYPDGAKVYCMAIVNLKGGKIARQTVVQAWDE